MALKHSFGLVKFLIFFFLIFGVLATEARPKDISVNQDVFVCPNEVRALPIAEYQIINGKKIGLTEKLKTKEDLVHWVNDELNQFTASRARLFNRIAQNFGGQISYKKNIQIQRVSFPSQLVLPKSCEVQPIAIFTLAVDSINKPFSAIVNQDLFDRLSPEDQVIVLWGIALDVEQTTFAMNVMRNDLTADFEFNQVRARQFIQCWLDPDCKPKTAAEFNTMSRNLNLDYYEQQEVLIPRADAVFGKNGLIIQSQRLVYLLGTDFNDVFFSRSLFPDQSLTIPSIAGSDFSQAVIFHRDGKLQCAGLMNVVQTNGIFSGKWNTVSSGTAFPFEFPLCWNEKFQLTQGYFPISWDFTFSFKIQDQILRIEDDPLGGGRDQGTIVILNPQDLSIKWVNHVVGKLSLGVNGLLNIKGYLKLRQDQSVECAQISEDKNLKSATGGIYKFRLSDMTHDYLLCFNQRGEYEKSYSIFDFARFVQNDLILVGN